MKLDEYRKTLEKMRLKKERLELKARMRLETERLRSKASKERVVAKFKKKSMRELKKELKTITHAIVRLRYDNCYSCDEFVPLKERQAGHYHTDGGNPGTRYDFNNLRTQHASCNYFSGGDAHFGARLLQEIGQEAFLELDRKRKIKQTWSREELEALIEERKVILKNLKDGQKLL